MRKMPQRGQPSPHRLLEQEAAVERRQLNVYLRAEWVDYVRMMAAAKRKKPYQIVEDALALYREEAGEP